jgi:hypothetical protein
MLKSESGNQSIKQIIITCPICKIQKPLDLPVSIIKQDRQLTTVSIPNDFICPHHFQFFLDKYFKIRGYQKVDHIVEADGTIHLKNRDDGTKGNSEGNKQLQEVKVVNAEAGYSFYGANIHLKTSANQRDHVLIEKTLEEIYEENWYLIDDSDETFQEFIQNDQERRNKYRLPLSRE